MSSERARSATIASRVWRPRMCFSMRRASRGPRGGLVLDAGTSPHIPSIRVDAVDPTGAGDAFIGSLAVFLGEGAPLLDAVRRASAVAALSVTRIGTQVSFPSRQEANTFLAQHGLA